ncbi:hypothetical protein N7509_006550 [Penicillium cosmopolitanum]|uniref:Uncharacterized protein n=1 Tax=Penicillium cosmopolitanum TaxID=1131564 RepID=A0A9W9VXJ8_9EURO|nr:uncharacterized protein N7509_006550 [Penicillium cosmopolitanum]KAJ5391060.1 hypothetical protein N7509_006550 [Penicillium cosmopolitanum]
MIHHQQIQQRCIEEAPNAVPNRAPHTVDPIVEERISRLLQQMRQNAVAAAEDSPSPSSILSHMAKARKDEGNMDEDESLLTSEEGRRLSSK